MCFSILLPDERQKGFLLLFMAIIMALFEAVGVASVLPFFAVIGNPDIIYDHPQLNDLYVVLNSVGVTTQDAFLACLGAASFFMIVMSAGYRMLAQFQMNRFIEMIRYSVSCRLLTAYVEQPYEFFLGRNSAEMSKVVLSEVDQFIGGTLRPFFSVVTYSCVMVAITVLLVLTDPVLALIAAGGFGSLYFLVMLNVKQSLTELGIMRVAANRERFLAASETLGGIKELKLLGREHSYVERFTLPSKRFAETHASHQTITQLPNFLIEALVFGAIVAVTIVLLALNGGVQDGGLGRIAPSLGLFAISAFRMKPAIQNIYRGLASLRYGQAAVSHLHTELKLCSRLSPRREIQEQIKVPSDSVYLDNLRFAYPGSEMDAIRGVSLEISLGSSLGVVGRSGSGKTTLIDILLGLLRPQSGEIRADGVTITDQRLRSWQKFLGYVPQDIYLTDASVSSNIALGIDANVIDQERVITCAKMASIHDFIETELDQGYETLLGERGVRISGGQRQRIGIARALYHDPEILIFDEATSALDNITERNVIDAIDQLAGRKTIVVIAHRLSTVRSCDQIAVLDRGKIKSLGTYEELLINDEELLRKTRQDLFQAG